MRSLFAALAVTFLASTTFAEEKKVTLSGDNTKITWVGTKPGGKHEGGFKTLTGTATVDVEVVSFSTVQAGAFHSCGLAASGAYCWGSGTYGEVGNGANPSPLGAHAIACEKLAPNIPGFAIAVAVDGRIVWSEAFGYAERAKARVLVEVLKNGRAQLGGIMTAEERQHDRDLKVELASLNK